MTIDILPDIALLNVFDFYLDELIEAWRTLVHVCRKWRDVVLGSPRRLNLRLFCTDRTPIPMLDNRDWPPLPIVLMVHQRCWSTWFMDNIIAALEHNDRICELHLVDIPSLQSETFWGALQRPFTALTRLWLQTTGETAPVIPDSFLGGFAPRLQTLDLNWTPFPGLPKLLSSATYLVRLSLWRIPYSGYISPEAMATCLSVLTRLESLIIEFRSFRTHPDQIPRRPLPLPPTRSLLPALAEFRFRGVGKYLEDLVSRIDAPLLENLAITFPNQLIFNSPQLTQFISRVIKASEFEAHDTARVAFSDRVSFTLPHKLDGRLCLEISWIPIYGQLSSLVQVCSSCLPRTLISSVEHLHILQDRFSELHWQDDIERSQWRELLHLFDAVKVLHIFQEFEPRITPALQELVGERVLPTLQTLFNEETLSSGPVHWQGAVRRFERQFATDSSHPEDIEGWLRGLE